MDARRFDAWTQRLQRPRSRRSVGRALIGGLTGVLFGGLARDPVAARANSVPLGDVCYRDRQCLNDYVAPRGAGLNPDYQIVYCADNGFDWDGEFNCCRYSGGFCQGDNHCCGDLACNDNFCGPYEYLYG